MGEAKKTWHLYISNVSLHINKKRYKLNVTIKDIKLLKLSESRGVKVFVIFNCRDITDQKNFMYKRYEIIDRVWYDRFFHDYCKIGIHIIEQKNLEEQLRKVIGKPVHITYLEKGNVYRNIFFESEGVDEAYKSISVNDVLESILAKEPLYVDDDFMDDDQPLSDKEMLELINQ